MHPWASGIVSSRQARTVAPDPELHDHEVGAVDRPLAVLRERDRSGPIRP
jgi:hypothetical protein